MPYKRGTKWIGQIRIEGRRKEKIFLSKKEALAWESENQNHPEKIWPERIDTISLYDWAQAYLDFAKAQYAKITYQEKCVVFRRFFEKVDPMLPVHELKPATVQAFIVEQKLGRSGNAANKDRKNLIAGWNWGMEYMLPPLPGPTNPCKVRKAPEIRSPRYVPPEEDFWKAYHLVTGQDRIMLLCYLHLAARRSEIFRMTWDDVDFLNGRIRLWTRKRRDGSYEYDWLPMTQELQNAMQWWWENRTFREKSHVFLCQEKNNFCEERYGEPFIYRINFMRRLCDKAKVKRFGFHAIRHLTASTLYRQGNPLSVIQAILRHKSATTTASYVRSLGLEHVREALEGLTFKKGNVVGFPSRKIGEGKVPQNEKAVSGAVNSENSFFYQQQQIVVS